MSVQPSHSERLTAMYSRITGEASASLGWSGVRARRAARADASLAGGLHYVCPLCRATRETAASGRHPLECSPRGVCSSMTARVAGALDAEQHCGVGTAVAVERPDLSLGRPSDICRMRFEPRHGCVVAQIQQLIRPEEAQ